MPSRRPSPPLRVRRAAPTTDAAAVQRIWGDLGWVGRRSDSADECANLLDAFDGWVAEAGDGALIGVLTAADGTLRHGAEDLPVIALSHVAVDVAHRARGVGRALVAGALRDAAARGAVAAFVGVEREGYWRDLGFAPGPRVSHVTLRPRELPRPGAAVGERDVVRLGPEDALALHHALIGRARSHGGVTLNHPITVAVTLGDAGFGLGLRGPDGAIGEVAWLEPAADGGYALFWLGYRDLPGLRALLGALATLDHQVRRLTLDEPPGLALPGAARASRPWLARLLDVGVARAALEAAASRPLALTVTDPLDDDAGPLCVAADGSGAPLAADVAALTALWLGTRSARSLATFDRLDADGALLDALDARRPPPPWAGWRL